MNHSSSQTLQPPPIPATVRIGVTGHRQLADEAQLRKSVQAVLAKLDKLLEHTPHTFVAVSPLAEGADRLVASEVLNWAGAGSAKPSLEVLLPLPEDDYRHDFVSPASQREFSALLDRAASRQTLSPCASRDAAYEQVGHEVVKRCDVLIAIWDGKEARGQGGTGDIIHYARELERTIFIIQSETGKITPESGQDHSLEALERLDMYNHEHLSEADARRAIEQNYARLVTYAGRAGLDKDYLEPLRKDLLPQFVRADLLAARYQNDYSKIGGAIYALATVAVAIIAIQKIFMPEFSWLVFIEVAAMVAILMLIYFSDKRDWHRKWIDYRSLAERLRSAFFLSLVGTDCQPDTSHPQGLLRGSNEWMVTAFARIWETCPSDRPVPPSMFDPLKKFVLAAWIRDQRDWFHRRGKHHRSRHEAMVLMGVALFGVTLIAALIHATGFVYLWIPRNILLPEDLLTLLAIVLPAAGAALAGYRVHREYERNAERYAYMVIILKMLTEQIEAAHEPEALAHWLKEANEVLLNENQDWRLAFLFQKLELP